MARLTDMRDPYNVLGIDRTATDEEIKRAYRKLAKELHPDSNPDNAEATERFKEVTAAYELLVDPQRRMEFERGGWRRGYADGFGRGNDDRPWDDGSVFDWSDGSGERPIDLFGDIAGNRRGRVSGAASTSMFVPGEDLAEAVKLTIKEAEDGTQKTLELMTGAVVEVDVPAGSKDGDTLTLEALGLPGFGGAPPGNLNLTMEIIPAPRLEAE